MVFCGNLKRALRRDVNERKSRMSFKFRIIKTKIVFCLLCMAVTISVSAESGTKTLLSEDFSREASDWKSISLRGTEGGSYKIRDSKLHVHSDGGSYCVYGSKPLSGHFYVEAEFDKDENLGLALIQAVDGVPDFDNFTMICVEKNDEGKIVVRASDRQNGKDDVLDNTLDSTSSDRRKRRRLRHYKHVLDGTAYSVPFTGTNGKLRIFHDGPADFFHLFYGVEMEHEGKRYEDWMELTPSSGWGEKDQEYLVALVALSKGKAVFDSVRAVQKPTKDRDDSKTGFAATRREYNWSGVPDGEAVVITFGDHFGYDNKDMKFVFWSESCYVPAWHLNNQLHFSYEFGETWGGGNPGCHEPMSDRLRIWSWVKILEDNPVRKVVRWHYVLCNPDYKVPDHGQGDQLPEVDEYFTFYPDGTGTRRLVYTPKLDTDYRSRHELSELIAISGILSKCSDFFDSPALTVMNLDGDSQPAHPGPKFDYDNPISKWRQLIMAVHFKGMPDVIEAYSDDPAVPGTFSGYPIEYENAWHNTEGQIGHWPVNRIAYTSPNAAGAFWEAQVSHACLMSIGVIKGTDWTDHFKVDERGRKYRDFVSLVGLNPRGQNEQLREKTASWLHAPKVDAIESGYEFSEYDHSQMALILERDKKVDDCSLELAPAKDGTVIVNPVIRINNWGKSLPKQIAIGKEPVSNKNYEAAITEDDDLLIWLKTRLGERKIISIR